MATYYCFQCYARNTAPHGRCSACGGEIGQPAGISFDGQLIWALRHPLADRAMMAARILGQRRSKQAVPALQELSENPPDSYMGLQCRCSLHAIQRLP
jgi:hypothetical protein